MRAKFVQRAESIDFWPAQEIAAGEIVHLGSIIGITKNDIPAGSLGTLFLSGIFDVQKPDNLEFLPGENVFCDANGQIAKSGTLIGIAIPSAQKNSNTVRIILNSAANTNPPGVQDAEWQPL